jgi:hypothetical protein
MGKVWIFGNNKRPLVGEQNTGREAYARPFGVGTVSVQGSGGANNFRSLNPFNVSGVNPQLITNADIAGVGSYNGLSTNPYLRPLIDKSSDPSAIDGGVGVGPGGQTIPQSNAQF